MDSAPSSHIGTEQHFKAPLDSRERHAQIEAHEKKLATLNTEQAQLKKQIETLKAERQVLEAVARKLAKTRRSGTV
jgi:cell division protein FtsB